MLDKTSEATRHHKQFQTFNHKRLKIDYYELEIKNKTWFLSDRLGFSFDHCRSLSFLPCSLTRGVGVEFTPNSLIPNLGGSYISNLSLQICLESFKNFLWWVVGGWWVVVS